MTSKFDRDVLRVIRADIDAALKTVTEKHGVHFTTKGIRFNETTFKVTVEAALGATATDAERTAFERETGNGPLSTYFGRTFQYVGRTYKIVGYRSRARKNAVRVERDDGKRFVMPLEVVGAGLGLRGKP